MACSLIALNLSSSDNSTVLQYISGKDSETILWSARIRRYGGASAILITGTTQEPVIVVDL